MSCHALEFSWSYSLPSRALVVGDRYGPPLGVAVPWLVCCVARVRRDLQLVRTRSQT